LNRKATVINVKREKEEEEFLLCELIRRNIDNLDDLYDKTERAQSRLEKFTLEKKVHEKVLAKNKNKKEDWKYRFMDDFVFSGKEEIENLKDDIEYEKAWIAEAKKMITTTRYKSGIPDRHLRSFDFDFDEDFEDYEGCDCCEDGCGSHDEEGNNDRLVPVDDPF